MMKKNLIAAAALLAMAGAANAQMSLYGLIDMCYGKSLAADLFGDKSDVHSGGDNGNGECNSTTRFGLKGAYEVSKGTKINFNLESGGITSNGRVNGNSEDSNAFFARKMWAGISGEFGEVRVGRQDSVPYQVMGDFDFNGQSNGVTAGGYSAVGAWNTGRQSRSIQYIAPTGGGLTAQIGLVVKGNGGPTAKDVFSAGVKYAAGPVLVGAAYESKRDSNTKDFKSIAGSYDFGVAKVMASYADGGGDPLGITQWKGYVLGVVAPVGGFNVGAHYGVGKDKLGLGDKIKSLELFANKEVFKNTYAYVEAGDWKFDGPEFIQPKRKASGYAAGVIFVF